MAAGSEKAAVCTDCHGTHEILDAKDSKSPIFKFNVPKTCGKCHDTISKEVQQSIHGTAVAHGNWQAPVCTDCHGIHSIKAHTRSEFFGIGAELAQATCARCHEGVRLSQEFGVEGRREHHLPRELSRPAPRRGSQVVANCASCHGVHNILPSTDPRSTINQRESRPDLRPVPSRRYGEIHRCQGSRRCAALRRHRQHSGPLDSALLSRHDLRGDRRHAAAQPHHLAIKADRPAQNAARFRDCECHCAFAGSMPRLLTSFFTSCAHRLRVEVSRLLVCDRCWRMSEHLRHLLHRIAAVVLIGVSLYHIFDIALHPRRTQTGSRFVSHTGRRPWRVAECRLLPRA